MIRSGRRIQSRFGCALMLLLVLKPPRTFAGGTDHPTRTQIQLLIKANPGLPFNKLKDHFSLAWGTLYHHVWKLVKAKKLETVTVGRRRLLFIAGGASEDVILIRNYLQGATAEAVARTVMENPKISVKDLVSLTGESERAVYYHVKRLLDAGLLLSVSRTRHYGLTIQPRLEAYLVPVVRSIADQIDIAPESDICAASHV